MPMAGDPKALVSDLVRRARLASLSERTLYGDEAGGLYDALADEVLRLAALRASDGAGAVREIDALIIDVLARGLLAIAERPSWRAVHGGKDLFPTPPSYTGGYDSAARTRSERAAEALARAHLIRPFEGDVGQRVSALPLSDGGSHGA